MKKVEEMNKVEDLKPIRMMFAALAVVELAMWALVFVNWKGGI